MSSRVVYVDCYKHRFNPSQTPKRTSLSNAYTKTGGEEKNAAKKSSIYFLEVEERRSSSSRHRRRRRHIIKVQWAKKKLLTWLYFYFIFCVVVVVVVDFCRRQKKKKPRSIINSPPPNPQLSAMCSLTILPKSERKGKLHIIYYCVTAAAHLTTTIAGLCKKKQHTAAGGGGDDLYYSIKTTVTVVPLTQQHSLSVYPHHVDRGLGKAATAFSLVIITNIICRRLFKRCQGRQIKSHNSVVEGAAVSISLWCVKAAAAAAAEMAKNDSLISLQTADSNSVLISVQNYSRKSCCSYILAFFPCFIRKPVFLYCCTTKFSRAFSLNAWAPSYRLQSRVTTAAATPCIAACCSLWAAAAAAVVAAAAFISKWELETENWPPYSTLAVAMLSHAQVVVYFKRTPGLN